MSDNHELCRRVGRNLRIVLRMRGMTQADLVEATGLPSSSVSAVISSGRTPSLHSAILIAAAVRLHVEELALPQEELVRRLGASREVGDGS